MKKLSKKEGAERFLALFREEAGRLNPGSNSTHRSRKVARASPALWRSHEIAGLDRKPYIAAFFAFSGIASRANAPADHVAIWCLDTKSEIWDQETGIKLLTASSPYNERLKTQLGKFTLLTSPFDSVEDHINQCDEVGGTLKKVTLPAVEAKAALSDLDFMGINYSTIYPGLDGCARAAVLRMLVEQ